MLITGLFYIRIALQVPADAPAIAQLGPLIPYLLVVVIGSITIQIILAATAPREANQPADERERAAIDKAGNWAGYVLAFGMIGGAINYLVHGLGNWLFLWLVGTLVASQFIEYVFQIYLFRRGT